MAVPNRILEGIKACELNAQDFYSVYGKKSIEAGLNDLKKSDEEILAKYSAQDMKNAVAIKLANRKFGNKQAAESKTSNNVLKFPAYKIVSFAAAAVLLAAIVIPAGLRSSITSKTSAPTERIKGNAKTEAAAIETPQLNLYRQKGRAIQALSDGDFARSGDVIQITYNSGMEEYGVIFSVDGNGNITRHFPENSWDAEKLIHRTDETPLDFSYELDNAPDFECFIMVTSKKQFSLNDIESKIKNKTDINYLTALSYLPKKTEGTTFILEK